MNLNSKIKILFVHHTTGWGGSANSLINLICSLDHTKYDPEVLLIKNSIIADKLAKNKIKYSIAESKFYKKYYNFFPHSEAGYLKMYQIYNFIKLSILWILSYSIFAKRELSKHSYDIVHLNSSVLTDWLAPAKKRGKVVIHIREPFRKGKIDFLHYFFKSQIGKYADKIIAISNDNAKRINIDYKTTVMYNYSDVHPNLPNSSSYSSKKVLYLGGSSSSKGFYTLVDALDYLDKDIIVYFGGHFSKREKSKKILKEIYMLIFSKERKRNTAIEKIKNHHNAVFLGIIDDINYYLNEVCCLVSPFCVPHFSRPVIEAHLNRKPAIGTNVEGMEEIIDHGKNGLIVLKNNPKILAVAINELTSNSMLAKQFGEAGFLKAQKIYTKRNIKKLEQIYDTICN